MLMTILADDLTGACDTGALFAGRARVGVFVAPDAPGPEWETAAVDTVSRALAPADARRQIQAVATAVASRMRAGRLLKKIDSTMRGSVGAELDALMEAAPLESAVVCPGFPEQGRQVRGGVLLVEGRPAHETTVGSDPHYPRSTSRIGEILAAGSGRPVVELSLDEVRGSGPELVRVLRRAPGGFIVPDVETPGDLDLLARAALHHRRFLVAGSAGIARAVSALLGTAGRGARLPAGRGWLVLVGSAHPASRAQVEALAAAGVRGCWVEPAPASARLSGVVAALAEGAPAFIAAAPPSGPTTAAGRLAVADALARAAISVLAPRPPDLVAVVGGETLHALFRSLRAHRLELLGAPARGLALGEIVGDRRPVLRVLTKAGGFGAKDLWLNLLGLVPAAP